MVHKPIIMKRAPSLAPRAGWLLRCALVLVTSACGTIPATGAETTPTAKASPSGKAHDRRLARASKGKPPAAIPDKPSKPVEAKKPEVKKPAAQPEPDLPTRFPQPVFCPLPSEVPPREDLTIRCAIKPSLGAHNVIVQYRALGKETYSTTDAVRSPKGWYVAKIKGGEVTGNSLQIYVEAYSPGNLVVGSNGSDDNPNVILVQGEGSLGVGSDEDPLRRIQKEKEDEQMRIVEGKRRPSPSLWLGMGIGSAEGWYSNRTPESVQGSTASGWATGGWFHVLPEIGYNLTPHLAFSVQARYQFVKNETQGGAGEFSPPHSRALAVLGCAYLMTDSRTSSWQLFGTAVVGAGSAFRLYVASSPSSNPDRDRPNSDTVNGGPFVAGLGGGLIYHLTNYFAFTGHVRSLAGIPKTAVVIEGGLGVQLAIWPFDAYSSRKGTQVPEDLEPEPEYTPPED